MKGIFREIILLLSIALAVLGRSQAPLDSLEEDNPNSSFTSLPPLLDATLEQLSQGLEDGSFTSVDLVRAYIARIHETNPSLYAVTEINPDALSHAAALDAARRAGHVYSPLHGIPVLLKNNIATGPGDRMNTTAGSFALLGAAVSEDSTVAAKLRRAGAVLLGKSNLSQWSDARSQNTSSGWSAHGGQTRGAYRPDQMPCGSSAGSGVAASIGLAWAALGTETAGSIQCPACFNNVVGIKPTVGLTSRHLVVPISEHQDTVGPLARTVKDAAYLLSIIAGEDSSNDNYTSAIPFSEGRLPDYVNACQLSALEGKRIGIARDLFDFGDVVDNADGIEGPVMAAFNHSLDIIRSSGAVLVDDIAVPGWKSFQEGTFMRDTMRADLVTGIPLARYLSKLTTNPNNLTSLYDIRQFTHSYEPEEWPDRDTVVWDAALATGMNNTSPLFWSNLTAGLHLSGELGILGAIRNHSLDALVLPTYSALAPPAMVGSPAVTVPMGVYPPETPTTWDERGDLVGFGPGIPFGISFLGDLFSEETLIGIAYAFEQKTNIRHAIRPYVQPRTELRDVIGSGSLMDAQLEL